MPITFTTPGNASVTLLDHIGLAMLRRMGHSASVPGAIQAVDVAAARDRLNAAIDAERSPPSVAIDDADDDEPEVSLKHRALPLIDLLSAAAVSQSDVMWR